MIASLDPVHDMYVEEVLGMYSVLAVQCMYNSMLSKLNVQTARVWI